MKAAVVTSDGVIELAELPVPEVESRGALLLRTSVSSICGSDLHRFRSPSRPGSPPTAVLGHESVGVIVASGDPRFPVGQRVLHAPVVEAGRTFAEFQLADPGSVVPVPDGLTDERAVMAQQLGTVLWAMDHYALAHRVPASACVTGAGPAGLLFIQVLRRLGADVVMVSEPDEARRALAGSYGVSTCEPESFVENVLAVTSGRGADLIVECSGTTAARRDAAAAVGVDGVVGLFGIPDGDDSDLGIDLITLFEKNLAVVGVQNAQLEAGLGSFVAALRLIESGAVDVDALITHRVNLEGLPQAFAIARDISDGVVKVVVKVHPRD